MLDAARSIFAEKGFSKTTLEEIATRSEFGKGTIYNYFQGGKEDLLLTILNQLYDGAADICNTVFSDERLESEPIRELFREFLTKIFDYFADQQDLFIIHMKEAHSMLFADNRELAAAVSEKRDQVVTLLMRPLEAGMEAGQLRRQPAAEVSHLLFGNIKGMQMQECLFMRNARSAQYTGGDGAGQICSSAQKADFLISVLFDGLLTPTCGCDDGSTNK